MPRTLLRLTIACVLVVVGWGSSAAAWDTTAGNDTNYGSITFGGTGVDEGQSVAVDGSGNVYTTGYFQNTVDFGAGNVTSAGSFDVFVTKHNAAGAHQWTTTLGGTTSDVGYGVAVDGSGNVHVSGYFSGTVNFGAGNVTSAGNYDVFVTKLNSSGAHQWTTTLGGTGTDVGYGVAVDGSGNVYTAGYFNGTVNFGAGNVTPAGNNDVFV
ncbi:MAG: SBBP repeat-containing protein, partial [Acidimicrobiales bacterium]|nr:SBBP repeat-containing protein [Acidimicrobiales bacterium]